MKKLEPGQTIHDTVEFKERATVMDQKIPYSRMQETKTEIAELKQLLQDVDRVDIKKISISQYMKRIKSSKLSEND